MERDQARELLRKYREGRLTEQERAFLESWYLNVAQSQGSPSSVDSLEDNLDAVWQSLPLHSSPVRKLPASRSFVKWISVAASLFFVCSLGLLWIYQLRQPKPIAKTTPPQLDREPGANRALLVLADGSKIVLNDTKTGARIRRGDASLLKANEGQIIFDFQASSKQAASTEGAQRYNTLSTPKAGQYQIRLPDGINVWLNALSSLRFPSVFSQTERLAEVTGEAYFDVAKRIDGHKKVPFKVVTGQQTIEVLGTQFNVNSYQDEDNAATTLLEGSVQIRLGNSRRNGIILRPGQQAQLRKAGQKPVPESEQLVVQTVDAESVISWKKGYFRFDDTSLPELLRQIARWYDVEFRFEGSIKEHEFVGQIERSANLSKVLKILELGGLRFRTEGKTIIVFE